jgi:hypothetical protein
MIISIPSGATKDAGSVRNRTDNVSAGLLFSYFLLLLIRRGRAVVAGERVRDSEKTVINLAVGYLGYHGVD